MTTKEADKKEEQKVNQLVICVGDTEMMQRAVAMHFLKARVDDKKETKRPVYVHTSNHEDVWLAFGKQHIPEQFAGVSGSFSGRIYTDDRDEHLQKVAKTCSSDQLLSVLDFGVWDPQRVAKIQHKTRLDHQILILTGEKNEFMGPKIAATCEAEEHSIAVISGVLQVLKAERPCWIDLSQRPIQPHRVTTEELQPFMIPSIMERIPFPNLF